MQMNHHNRRCLFESILFQDQTFDELMDAVAELRFTLKRDELEIADIIRYRFSPGAKIDVEPPSELN